MPGGAGSGRSGSSPPRVDARWATERILDHRSGLQAQVLPVHAGYELHALRKAFDDPGRNSHCRHPDKAYGGAQTHSRRHLAVLPDAADVEIHRRDRLGKDGPDRERRALEERRPFALRPLTQLGLSAATPANRAGMRTDPPASLPRPRADMPVARATASPRLDPPGLKPRFQGFTVAPNSRLRV